MRQGHVIYKNEVAGILTQQNDGSYLFEYLETWVNDANKKPISLTLPKTEMPYLSTYLFPFFYNLLPEGNNKTMVCRHNKIDENDDFGLLTTAALYDTIGAVSVIPFI